MSLAPSVAQPSWDAADARLPLVLVADRTFENGNHEQICVEGVQIVRKHSQRLGLLRRGHRPIIDRLLWRNASVTMASMPRVLFVAAVLSVSALIGGATIAAQSESKPKSEPKRPQVILKATPGSGTEAAGYRDLKVFFGPSSPTCTM